MATLRENAHYFRQIVHKRMNLMFASIAYYRHAFFEQAHTTAVYILTKIGQGLKWGYKAIYAFLRDSLTIAKWLVCNLPFELVKFLSFLVHKTGEFLRDLFTIIKPCIKWLAKYSFLALSKALGVFLGILLAIGDLAIEGIMFTLKHTIGLVFPSLFTSLSSTAVLRDPIVDCSPIQSPLTLQTIPNLYTPDFQRTQPITTLSVFPDQLHEKRASLTL